MLHPHPLKRDRRPRRSTPGQEHLLLATSSQAKNIPSWPRPCVQCQRMCHTVWPLMVHTSHTHHACATATHAPVKPRKSALIPFCNVPPPPGWARLHLAAFIGHRLPSQTNTSLFCTLCPHSCAIGKNFPIGHPSRNCSKLPQSFLEIGFFLLIWVF